MTQKKQVLQGLQVLFLLFNCQTPELKNTRLLLEKGDIKGAKKLLEEIIDETYADIEIE